MRVLHINSVCCTGSTGRIVAYLHDTLSDKNISSLVTYGRGDPFVKDGCVKIANRFDTHMHVFYSRIFDRSGFSSSRSTHRLIGMMRDFKPTIVHLHNLHGYYVNVELLFEYLKESNLPVVWTLHDCWAFTGHCSHFEDVGCYKWIEGCRSCIQKKEYPSSFFLDNSKWNYKRKKEIFTSISNLNIVTPSKWLADKVKDSFLSKNKLTVIHNGIDFDVFKPKKMTFRDKFNLQSKIVVLGVASVWTKKKGLEDFIRMSYKLDEKFKIVLVGLNEYQNKKLPKTIIGIQRTECLQDLVNIYSDCDVFVNPTYEENFPTTNLEALACGVPVYTYDSGGSRETISPKCGILIQKGNINELEYVIKEVKTYKFQSKDCVEFARKYSIQNMTNGYMSLYSEIDRIQLGML